MQLLDRLDAAQRSRAWLAFPVAVLRKYGEDRGGHRAALIAFYGFFALFPLLLVGVTVLGVLFDGPEARERILRSALAGFPVIGDQIRESVGAVRGSPLVVASALAGAWWAALGGIGAVQIAMDEVWDVPVRAQPSLVTRVLRGSVMLGALGVFTLGAMTTAILAPAGASLWVTIAGFVVTLVLDVAVFLLAFKILTVRDVSWRDVVPGALLAGVLWVILQGIGGWFVRTRLAGASDTYGFFGIVIGTLSWMVLSAQIMLVAAEVNVVRRDRLWPRSFSADPRTEADRRTLTRHAKVEERAPSEEVSVAFSPRSRRVASRRR